MRDGDLTYDDFLQRLNIQDVLIDAGYHLNRRDGLRYPSYHQGASALFHGVPCGYVSRQTGESCL